MDWDIEVPKKILQREKYYIKEIRKAAKKDLVISELYTDNIIDTIALNNALNFCITLEVFDKKLKKGLSIGRAILKFLEDLKVYSIEEVVSYFEAEGNLSTTIKKELQHLAKNGLIKIHKNKVGRGSCLVLWELKNTLLLYNLKRMFPIDKGFRDYLKYSDRKNRILKKFQWDQKQQKLLPNKVKLTSIERITRKSCDVFNYMLKHGLIKITEQDEETIFEYEITHLGKYVANILSHCEIAQLKT